MLCKWMFRKTNTWIKWSVQSAKWQPSLEGKSQFPGSGLFLSQPVAYKVFIVRRYVQNSRISLLYPSPPTSVMKWGILFLSNSPSKWRGGKRLWQDWDEDLDGGQRRGAEGKWASGTRFKELRLSGFLAKVSPQAPWLDPQALPLTYFWHLPPLAASEQNLSLPLATEGEFRLNFSSLQI